MTNPLDQTRLTMGAIKSRLAAEKTSSLYQGLQNDPNALMNGADHYLRQALRDLSAEESAENAYWASIHQAERDVIDVSLASDNREKARLSLRKFQERLEGSPSSPVDADLGTVEPGATTRPEPVDQRQPKEKFRMALGNLMKAMEQVTELLNDF